MYLENLVKHKHLFRLYIFILRLIIANLLNLSRKKFMLHYLINDPDYDLLMMIVSSDYCLSMAEDSKPIFNFGHKNKYFEFRL